jgi:hypothetical protein
MLVDEVTSILTDRQLQKHKHVANTSLSINQLQPEGYEVG